MDIISYSEVVITLDFESSIPGSSPGRRKTEHMHDAISVGSKLHPIVSVIAFCLAAPDALLSYMLGCKTTWIYCPPEVGTAHHQDLLVGLMRLNYVCKL
jgi:hypothetical protein